MPHATPCLQPANDSWRTKRGHSAQSADSDVAELGTGTCKENDYPLVTSESQGIRGLCSPIITHQSRPVFQCDPRLAQVLEDLEGNTFSYLLEKACLLHKGAASLLLPYLLHWWSELAISIIFLACSILLLCGLESYRKAIAGIPSCLSASHCSTFRFLATAFWK